MISLNAHPRLRFDNFVRVNKITRKIIMGTIGSLKEWVGGGGFGTIIIIAQQGPCTRNPLSFPRSLAKDILGAETYPETQSLPT